MSQWSPSSGGEDSFIAEVTHGLRSPLALVIGYGDDLLRRARKDRLSELIPDLERVVQSARTLVVTLDRVFREFDENRPLSGGPEATARGLLSIITHDLRSPLAIILGFTDFLLRPSRVTSSGFLADLRLIHELGRDMIDLINDLLNLEQARGGKVITPNSTLFEPVRLIEDRLASIEQQARRNHSQFEFRPSSDLGTMQSDPTLLWRILTNLLSNACKFTKGGRIILSAASEGGPGAGRIVFRIVDTGIGMEREQVRALAARLEGDDPIPSLAEGFGLGFAVCKLYTSSLGGEIKVQSVVGRGTRASLRLPRRLERVGCPDQGIPPRVSTRESARRKGSLVLVADDQADARELLVRNLEQAGYQTSQVAGGWECLRQARELHPAAILLDVNMPDLDGWMVLGELKENLETRDIPVIMATVDDDDDRGRRLGASGFLVKPIRHDQLIQALDSTEIVG